MMKFSKIFSLGALLVASASIAHADTISGGINVGGADSFTSTSIIFNPTTGVVTAANGNLAAFIFSTVSLQGFSFGSANGVQIFKTTNALGDTLTFTDVTLAPAIVYTDQNGRPALTLAGTGTFTETGVGSTLGTFTPTLGAFTLTSSTSASGTSTITGFQLDGTSPIGTAVTPEPSSLILLGTGLTSAAGMLIRRRRIGSTLRS